LHFAWLLIGALLRDLLSLSATDTVLFLAGVLLVIGGLWALI
jgi:hypothetical protein